MMRTHGWVGPLVGLLICILLLWLVVPATVGILHTLLFALFIIGAVACAVLLVVGLIRQA